MAHGRKNIQNFVLVKTYPNPPPPPPAQTDRRTHMPLSIDGAATTPFREENPRRCQLPLTETPISRISPSIEFFKSLAAAFILFYATTLAASHKTLLMLIKFLTVIGLGMFNIPQSFSKLVWAPPIVLMPYTAMKLTSKGFTPLLQTLTPAFSTVLEVYNSFLYPQPHNIFKKEASPFLLSSSSLIYKLPVSKHSGQHKQEKNFIKNSYIKKPETLKVPFSRCFEPFDFFWRHCWQLDLICATNFLKPPPLLCDLLFLGYALLMACLVQRPASPFPLSRVFCSTSSITARKNTTANSIGIFPSSNAE